MDFSVDVSHELKITQSKFFRLSLMFSIILTITIVSDVLLIIFAKEDYIFNLILTIVITTLFGWFAVYYFVNIYSDINNKYRFYKGYESGLHPTEEVEYLNKDDVLTYMNGLYVYPIHVRYFEGLDTKDKVIYVTDYNIDFNEGDKLTITTYQRILIKAVYHS